MTSKKLKILGINEFTHDIGAALIENEKIVAAFEEERFSRIKHHSGFEKDGKEPLISLQNSVKSFSDCNYIAISWNTTLLKWLKAKYAMLSFYRKTNVLHTLQNSKSNSLLIMFKSVLKNYYNRNRFLNKIKKQAEVIFINHHLCHASYSYRTSNFKKSLIFVIDGAGEQESTSIFIGENNKIKLIKQYPINQSIGLLYSLITRLIGFKKYEEGKTMALAGYGKQLKNISFLCYDKIKDEFIIDFNSVKKISQYQRKPEEEIGFGVLLNTSFNVNEPIVNTPQDAINTFKNSSLDVLYIEDFRIEK